MALDLAAMQAALREEGLDGWLLYDFHGSNPIARRLLGIGGGGKLTTRRWFYLIGASGEPQALVHAIERQTLDGVPGGKRVYAGREQLQSHLRSMLDGRARIAMEYSPGGDIPYLARVDAGTIENIRAMGVEVVSSGDLVQRFEACWDEAAIASHTAASERLYRIKDRALQAIAERAPNGTATEHEIQRLMAGWFADEGLVSDSAPVVAVNANAGDPHYLPSRDSSAMIRRDQLILLDLWGKMRAPGAVYADITWVGFTGSRVPPAMAAAFAAAANARDAAVELVSAAARRGSTLRGFEVDRAARRVLVDAGYGDHVLHRTGHSLGETVHGNGAHLDDFETHDDRRLLPGSGFTIEPGLYFDTFGVRTEINMVLGARDARVTGPVQREIVTLA